MTFVVSVAAPDRKLVAYQDVVDAISEEVTNQTILFVSDLISVECRVATAGASPPTLREETIIETVRIAYSKPDIILSRRFVSAITSVTVDGSALGSTEYEIDGASGILTRLDSSGGVICWEAGKIVVTYKAGFLTVPEPLRLVTIRAIQEHISASARDPLLKGETVENIGRFDYWVNAGNSVSAISASVSAMLAPYRSLYI